jgi:hypothetical protein
MLDGGFIQNSKLLIQNFAARAECAFPRDHFLTGFTELTGLVGLGQEEIQASVFRGEARFYPAPRA